MRCKVGDLCIVIRSANGNEGRECTVLRWSRELGPLPELGACWAAARDGWVVEMARPFQDGSTIGLFGDEQLLPIRPGAAETDGADETLQWASRPEPIEIAHG